MHVDKNFVLVLFGVFLVFFLPEYVSKDWNLEL